MVEKTYVTINAINVTSYIISWVIDDEIEKDFATNSDVIMTKNVVDVVDITSGQEVIIYRGDTTGQENLMFRGLVETKTINHPYISINAKDKLYALKKEEVIYSYDKNIDASAGVPSEIFLDLINTHSSLTATSSTVQDSAVLLSGVILDKFVCNHDTIFERCQFLADILDWQFYYNPVTDLVYLEPRGFTEYGTSLVTGVHLIDTPSWEIDNSMCINKTTVLGARQLVETTETFDGDASETEFQLSKVPESIKINVDSVLQTGGITRSTTTFDYSVDTNPDVRKVIFESGSVPGVGVANIEVLYSYSVPVPVAGNNYESQEAYGIYEKTLVYEDIKTVDDAEEKARQVLAKYSTPFAKTNIKFTGVSDIRSGYLVSVEDSINNQNRTLVAQKVIYSYPYQGDEIDLSDKEWKLQTWLISMEERIKKVEREYTKNQEQLVHLLDLTHTTKFNKRYTIAYTRDTTTDTLYGKTTSTYGAATSLYGDYDNALVEARIVWPDEIVKETFIDTDFKDASTTANWDTTLKRCQID